MLKEWFTLSLTFSLGPLSLSKSLVFLPFPFPMSTVTVTFCLPLCMHTVSLLHFLPHNAYCQSFSHTLFRFVSLILCPPSHSLFFSLPFSHHHVFVILLTGSVMTHAAPAERIQLVPWQGEAPLLPHTALLPQRQLRGNNNGRAGRSSGSGSS